MSAETKDHSGCDVVRMCLSEVGLDPTRMRCDTDPTFLCLLHAGTGSEGFTAEEVDRLTDRALEIANRATGESTP